MGRGNKSIQMKTSHRHLPQVTDKFYHKKLKIVYKTCLPVGREFEGFAKTPAIW